MRELRLRVPSAELEEALDALLPALPGGVHVRDRDDLAEVAVLAGPSTPGAEEVRALLGPRLVELEEREVSDDWRQRRLARYEPLVVGGRFLVRPDWAPWGEDRALIEVVLAPSAAFGSGVHPTTAACLTALAGVEPRGSLLDCGCGSGVLSIGAAKLGWSPVRALDLDEGAVAATRANAELNGVAVEARCVDLTAEAPPEADAIVANVPPSVHLALAPRVEEKPALAILSGFKQEEVEPVASAWTALGLEVAAHVPAHDWSLLVLR